MVSKQYCIIRPNKKYHIYFSRISCTTPSYGRQNRLELNDEYTTPSLEHETNLNSAQDTNNFKKQITSRNKKNNILQQPLVIDQSASLSTIHHPTNLSGRILPTTAFRSPNTAINSAQQGHTQQNTPHTTTQQAV